MAMTKSDRAFWFRCHITSILQQVSTLSADIVKSWALKHKMPLHPRSLPGAQGQGAKYSNDILEMSVLESSQVASRQIHTEALLTFLGEQQDIGKAATQLL